MRNQMPDSFKIWSNELEVLARHYLDQLREEEFAIEFLGGGADLRRDLYRRLGDIADVLGKERLQKAIASVEEKWDRRFAEAEQFEKNLEPCKSCGKKPTHADYVHCPDRPCTSCGNSITSPARPPRYIHRFGSRTVVDLSKMEEGKS